MDHNLRSSSDPRLLHYSLRTLLFTLGGACLILAPVHWFGAVYLFSVGLSVGLVLCCALTYRNSGGAAVVVAVAGLFLGILLGVVTMMFCIHAFFNFWLCSALAVTKARPKVFASGLAALMIAAYGVVIWKGAAEIRRLTALKAEFPFESLAQRLSFERNEAKEAADEIAPGNPIQLAAAVSANLDEQDEQQDPRYSGRSWSLHRLHENTYYEFARVAGFGSSRMPSLRYARFELEPRPQFKLPALLAIGALNTAYPSFDDVHRDFVRSFVDVERMGYARSRDEVAGFEPHALSTLSAEKGEMKAALNWQVVRLELVSLLRNAEPSVYEADTMPRMDQLANTSHRPLNDFEKSALPQLSSQTDLVVDSQLAHIQMLGAVRAGKTCLECHGGERGKLLGAFSYEIVPLPVVEKTTAAWTRHQQQR